MINFVNGENVQLTGDAAREYFPSWSPDGGSIVFASDAAGFSHLWLLTLPKE
jgi:Tol biopolymer transport system component